jgi:hypothetical protein
MVETIAPVVHGGNRRRWAAALALHALGATMSAATLGALLGASGDLLGAPWGPVSGMAVAVVALLYAAREAFGLPVPVLDARRQVPQWWRERFRPGPTAFLYGAGLGIGFATHLRHGTLVAAAAAVLAWGDPVAGAVVLAAFGLARSGGIAVTWSASDPSSARRLDAALERVAVSVLPRAANGSALLLVAVAAVATARTTPSPSIGPVPALILATALGGAAVAKVARPRAWRDAVAAHELPDVVGSAVSVAVPLAEASVAFLVLAGSIRAGAGVALASLTAFSVALVRLRARVGVRVPCGCFGSRRRRDVRLLLLRNAALGLVAVAALAGPDRLTGLRGPTSSELAPAVLVAAGILLAAALVHRALTMIGEARPGPVG